MYNIDEENSDIDFQVTGDKVAMKVRNSSGQGGGSDIYLIKESDATSPSDSNTFSALRVIKEIKDKSYSPLNKSILDKIDQELSTSSAVKFAAATIVGLFACGSITADVATFKNLNVDAITAPNINCETIVATRSVTSPIFKGDLEGNADTASKLKTPHLIWGNSFDGSQDVTGDLNLGTSSIYGNGALMIANLANGIGLAKDTFVYQNIGTSNYISRTTGWQINAAGNADFRNIYADEMKVQVFTCDLAQALAGSDYLTKSVSKLSENFVVPAVGSSARLIVEDLPGFPGMQCFTNGDYIRLRPMVRNAGLTVSNAWGTVVLDTTFGTNGFSNGTQAYTFTCTATTGAGITCFKGNEVLDYGKSGDGLIVRTTLDSAGSPYSQIETWTTDPSVAENHTVHARLGNLAGIANCSGFGLYSDRAYLTQSVLVGDLTKNGNFLSYDTVNGLLIKIGTSNVATSEDVTGAVSAAKVEIDDKLSTKVEKTDYNAEIAILNNSINAKVSQNDFDALGNRVTNAESSITANANAIKLKVAQSDFDSLTNRVSTAESSITQNADAIKTKVAQTSFDSLSSRVTNAESSITQNANNIALKVSSSDYNGSTIASLINQSASTVTIAAEHINLSGYVTISSYNTGMANAYDYAATAAITAANNVRIGGRNLLALTKLVNGTKTSTGYTGALFAKEVWNNEYFISHLKPSTEYTITFDFKLKSVPYSTLWTNSFGIYIYKTASIFTTFYLSVTPVVGKTYHVEKIFTTPSDLTDYSFYCSTGYYKGTDNDNNTVYDAGMAEFSNLKLEIGNKSTDFTSAPEDLLSTMSSYQATAQENIATKLGYASYADLVNYAKGNQTIIIGGHINTTLIEAYAITANMIAAGAITADKIDAGAITADKIQTGCITADKIQTETITTLGAITAGSFNIGSGKFVVTANGDLTATSATISGTVTASNGTIGGFKIEGARLCTNSGAYDYDSASQFFMYSSGSSPFMGYSATSRWAELGINVFSAAVGYPAMLRLEDYATSPVYFTKVGAYFNIDGSSDASSADASPVYGNHAIYINKGDICGFRLKTRRTNSSMTLSAMDSIINCVNTSTITITLPAGCEDGQIYYIYTNGTAILITCASGCSGYMDDHYFSSSITQNVPNWDLAICIYDKYNSRWQVRDTRQS